MPDEPIQELWVALAGPAVNVAIAVLLSVGCRHRDYGNPWTDWVSQSEDSPSGSSSPMLCSPVFNVLSAFPMDGGRVLRALLATRMGYTRATQRAAMIGQGMATVFGFLGLQGNPMLIFVALFVWIGAGEQASMAQMKSALAGIPVRQAMLTHFRTLIPENTLGDAVDLLLTGSQQDFPVVHDGRVDGMLTRKGLVAALTRGGRNARVGDHVERMCATAEASDMLETVLARLQGRDCHTVPITERGTLIGLVTMDNVGEFLMIQAAERKSRPAVSAP